MGRLYLYYKKHNNSMLGDVLKVKIDERITTEILANEVYEQNFDDGVHNIKMYFEGWTKDQLVGYVDRDIAINGNTYYIYKPPSTLVWKGKLVKADYNSPEEFNKKVNTINKKHKISDLIFITIFLMFIVLSILYYIYLLIKN